MNVKDVAEEIAAKLSAIDGLRAFAYPVSRLPLPGAVVGLPDDIAYYQTYQRGMDTMTLPVWVMVGRGDERAAALELMPFLDGASAKSVRAALEGNAGDYESCDTVTVTTAVTGAYSYNGVDTFGAEFTVEISGRGGP